MVAASTQAARYQSYLLPVFLCVGRFLAADADRVYGRLPRGGGGGRRTGIPPFSPPSFAVTRRWPPCRTGSSESAAGPASCIGRRDGRGLDAAAVRRGRRVRPSRSLRKKGALRALRGTVFLDLIRKAVRGSRVLLCSCRSPGQPLSFGWPLPARAPGLRYVVRLPGRGVPEQVLARACAHRGSAATCL